MTQYLEEAIGKHVLAREEFIKEDSGKLTDNLYYSALHEDASVDHHFSRVCFADLRYTWGNMNREHYEHDEDDEETFPSMSPITHVILHKWGQLVDPAREIHKPKQKDYLRAVSAWCQLFGQFVEEREEAIIVDVRQANVHAIGAMLVGFRNLGEQNTYTVFNLFLEHGFSASQAAWLSQALTYSKKDGMKFAGSSHRISERSMCWSSKDSFFKYMNTCVLFDPKQMLDKESNGRTHFNWSIGERYNEPGKREELLGWFHSIGLVNKVTDRWGGNLFPQFHVDKTIQFFKENRA